MCDALFWLDYAHHQRNSAIYLLMSHYYWTFMKVDPYTYPSCLIVGSVGNIFILFHRFCDLKKRKEKGRKQGCMFLFEVLILFSFFINSKCLLVHNLIAPLPKQITLCCVFYHNYHILVMNCPIQPKSLCSNVVVV